jgi:hypothetical protein
MRRAGTSIALLLASCGAPDGAGAPPAEMVARTWQYYAAHPDEIEPMQKICREWAGSGAPAGSEPAVVTTNCRAAAFAKSQRQIGS